MAIVASDRVLALMANAPTSLSIVLTVFLISARIVDIRVLSIDLHSLVRGVAMLTATR